jgi:hypothetical protein
MWLYIILIVLLVISVGANIAMGIVIKNNLLKISIYEGWILSTLNECKQAYLRLKEIDDKQMFEKDDDVGFIFTSMLNIIDELEKKIE